MISAKKPLFISLSDVSTSVMTKGMRAQLCVSVVLTHFTTDPSIKSPASVSKLCKSLPSRKWNTKYVINRRGGRLIHIFHKLVCFMFVMPFLLMFGL